MSLLRDRSAELAADIARIRRQYRPADVIEDQALTSGTAQAVWLRAQDPAGACGGPLLALVFRGQPGRPWAGGDDRLR